MTVSATGILAASVRLSEESGFDENSVTPGVVGFIAIFLIAAVTILLLIDMTRRIRRTRYRGEIAARLDAEEAAAGGAGTRPRPEPNGDFPGDDPRDRLR